MLWRDLPGALLPETSAGPFPSRQAQAIQRLSSNGHWVVPVDVLGIGIVTLLTFPAAPPVFDGPEDRNGKRNHDELLFWRHFMDEAFGPAPDQQFILLGDANADLARGEGIRAAIQMLLADPRLQDPLPDQITVNWPDPLPGDMRVDYVLPSADWTVTNAGIAQVLDAPDSRHALVWADLTP